MTPCGLVDISPYLEAANHTFRQQRDSSKLQNFSTRLYGVTCHSMCHCILCTNQGTVTAATWKPDCQALLHISQKLKL